MKPKVAVVSFPGNNGDTENLRTLWRCVFNAFVFRWNDSLELLHNVDGYFIGAGFSYEDRGRAGMVAARDPLFAYLHEEAAKGKVIVGHCNGCQMLVESGLIPLGDGLQMCMARNVVDTTSVGFNNEWIWITPACQRDRCATSDWEGAMHIPIAHGEGRWVTKDPDLLHELQQSDQIAFQYCNEQAKATEDAPYCPNGSVLGIAGVCNSAGNVVAMMPHAERTTNGDPYFRSMCHWIQNGKGQDAQVPQSTATYNFTITDHATKDIEIYIDTTIVNNEERTVEQAATNIQPGIRVKQLRYISPGAREVADILTTISLFNPNKEIAYIRRGNTVTKWNSATKSEVHAESPLRSGIPILRRDEPDTGKAALGSGAETGVCYVCSDVKQVQLEDPTLLHVFANPHASTLQYIL